MSHNYRKNLTVRVGDDERAFLEKSAKESGISLTRYIRKVALGEHPQTNWKLNGSCITDKHLLDLYKELTKIGTNLNQIAKNLNTQQAERKARGEGGIDLGDYPVKKILNLVKAYEITMKNISEIKTLIREVV